MLIYMFDDRLDPANTPLLGGAGDTGGKAEMGLYHLDVYYDFGYVNSRACVAGQMACSWVIATGWPKLAMLEMVDFENRQGLYFLEPVCQCRRCP